MTVDLRGPDLKRVADAIFLHPVAEDGGITSWWWRSEIELNPAEHAANLAALFRGPEFFGSRYTRDQLEQGVWYLISGAPGGIESVLWDSEIPWDLRADLVASTIDLFEKWFAIDALDTSVHMFWDALAYGYCVPTRYPDTDPEDRRIQDALFAALVRILAIDSLDCQVSALHGLGHLRHPDTERAITEYLKGHPSLSDETRQYARACITGEIL